MQVGELNTFSPLMFERMLMSEKPLFYGNYILGIRIGTFYKSTDDFLKLICHINKNNLSQSET